jgi:hypothetical protein
VPRFIITPGRFQRAEAEVTRNELFAQHGLGVPGAPALLHFSRRIDVVVWLLEPVDG